MSSSRKPFQSLETNKRINTAALNSKSLSNFKQNDPNRKGSTMDAQDLKKEDTNIKINPIKAPALKNEHTFRSAPPPKYSIVAGKAVKSFIVFEDPPIKPEKVEVKNKPNPRLLNPGRRKYRDKLSVVENEYQQIFCDNDTPVRRLPYDCLVEIFLYCKDIDTLMESARVCRTWRKVALQPSLWKKVTCNWANFNRQLSYLSRTIRSNRQLKHYRHLTITSLDNSPLSKSNYIRTTSPFKNMNTLHLSNIHMSDIKYITSWMTHIKTLVCTNIPVDTNGSVCIPNLTHLYQLDTLQLQFDKPCSLKLTYFVSAPDLERLPTCLKRLKITDLHDKEESELSQQDIIDAASYITSQETHWNNSLSPDQILTVWNRTEEQLVLKYTMLRFLTNLTSLSLHNVGSFTSKVWRECLIPCSAKLQRVSLSGWRNKRESPHAIMQSMNAYGGVRQGRLSEVDRAVSDFFASLDQIRSICLNDFICTEGMVMGIEALDKDYTIPDWPDTTLDSFTNRQLFDFYMSLKNKEEKC